MKKILLTFLAAIGLAATASAQLTEGSVFPYPGGASGGLTAVNAPFTGHRYNLDSLSNAGYTIFIDISATWCPPCWAYHQSKQLDTLWAKHGPAGMSGVDATTTNDVFVLFFQGEATSGLAELTYNTEGSGAILFSTTERPYRTVTQGNWVAGTPFPMIDDTTSSDASYGTGAIDAAWNIAFFPTVYMICRDHLVHNLTQPTYTEAYAAAQADCPTTPPSATYDAKTTGYLGNDYFVCTANPTLPFQNYSATNAITSATVTVTDATGATVATVPWTGSLAPYAVANVSVPAFTGTSFGGYKYSVSVTGDSNPANNTSADSVFKIYMSSNSNSLPATENFEGTTISYKEDFNTPDGNIAVGAFSGEIGADGTSASASSYISRNYYCNNGTVEEFIFGNLNTAATGGIEIQFDYAYAQYSASSADVLAVETSVDCGSTWSTAWTKSGATLATTGLFNTGEFYPTAGSQWKHVTATSPSINANTMVKFVTTDGLGNDIFIDNINITAVPTGVPQIAANTEINIVPNPAKDIAYVNLTLAESADVQVQLYDAVGRLISTSNQNLPAGAQKIDMSTNELPTGLYNVKIAVGSSVFVKQLSVIK